ncbi:hypothetical protein ACFX2F_004321 [Malus domestica]
MKKKGKTRKKVTWSRTRDLVLSHSTSAILQTQQSISLSLFKKSKQRSRDSSSLLHFCNGNRTPQSCTSPVPPPNLFTAANTEPLSSGRVRDPSKTKGRIVTARGKGAHTELLYTQQRWLLRSTKWKVNQIPVLR